MILAILTLLHISMPIEMLAFSDDLLNLNFMPCTVYQFSTRTLRYHYSLAVFCFVVQDERNWFLLILIFA